MSSPPGKNDVLLPSGVIYKWQYLMGQSFYPQAGGKILQLNNTIPELNHSADKSKGMIINI